MKLDGIQDIATTFMYSMFKVMRTCGLEVDNANPDIVIGAIQDKMMKQLVKFKRGQTEEGQTSSISCEVPDKELPSWQRVAYQLEDITPDKTQDIRQIFKELAKAYDAMGNACSLIAALSTDLKGPELKLLLQNTLQLLISLKMPEKILEAAETSDSEDKDETTLDDILKEINKTCFPKPSKVEDTNDVTCALAALVYFNLKQQLLGSANQFEVAARYKINQKHLIEILHGK